MLTVRVLPRRGVALRATLATVEVTGALALGHLGAGGSLPSVPWLVVMAAVVLGAGLLVLRGRVRPVVAVPALVVVQLLLHAWLTALAPAAAHAGHHGGQAGQATPLLDPSMIGIHVAGGLLTALLWELRARAAEVVLTWARTPLPPLPAVRRAVASVAVVVPVGRVVASVTPRRGPPVRPAVA